MRRKSSAFTLTELLAVMVIIGILMALLLPAIQRARRQALVSATRVTIAQIEDAIKMYIDAFGGPPPPPYQYLDNTNTLVGPPARPAAPADEYEYYYEDVDMTAAQRQYAEAHSSVDLNRDGDITDVFNIEVSLKPYRAPAGPSTWYAHNDAGNQGRLDDSEALYVFLTARFRKFAPRPPATDFGPQSDGTIILSATVNVGPLINPEEAKTCDIDEDGFLEFADAFGGPIRYNNNGFTGRYIVVGRDPSSGNVITERHKALGVDLYSYGPDKINNYGANDDVTGADDIANWHKK